MGILGLGLDGANAPVWHLDGSDSPKSPLQRIPEWEAMIAAKRYILPGSGSPDLEDWLKATELLSFLTGANHLNNRNYYAYGDITVNVGKGDKRTFAIVTETATWMLTKPGKRLRFFMAPHATLLGVHTNDTQKMISASHEWTEATLLEYHRGSIRTTPIKNLVATLSPAYSKTDGHANRRSESTVLAARSPRGYLYVPCVWSSSVGGRANSLEQGMFCVAIDGSSRFLAHDTTRLIGDLRVLHTNIKSEQDGTVYLKVDMLNTVTFDPASGAKILASMQAPYQERAI